MRRVKGVDLGFEMEKERGRGQNGMWVEWTKKEV